MGYCIKSSKIRVLHRNVIVKIDDMLDSFDSNVISVLQTLPELHQSKWKDHIKKLVFAYNCTIHSRTGYSPYFLLFGRTRKLPIEIMLPTECHIKGTHKDYINKWKEQMKEADKIVSKQGKNKDIQHTNSS